MKKTFLNLTILAFVVFGCTKDPVAPPVDITPALVDNNIYVWFGTVIEYSYIGSSVDTAYYSGIYAELWAVFKNFSSIKAGSDTTYGFSYLSNGKIINYRPWHPTSSFADTVNPSLWRTQCWYALYSGDYEPQLVDEDSLSFVDSTVAFYTWWYSGQRYSARRMIQPGETSKSTVTRNH